MPKKNPQNDPNAAHVPNDAIVATKEFPVTVNVFDTQERNYFSMGEGFGSFTGPDGKTKYDISRLLPGLSFEIRRAGERDKKIAVEFSVKDLLQKALEVLIEEEEKRPSQS